MMSTIGPARRALALLTVALATAAAAVACGSAPDKTGAPAAAPAASDPHAGHGSPPPAAPLRTGERFET
ncbi:hypothetical protein ACQP1P_32475 [Dactylosporangium sp. CA-052675]|uniref:hypothetical protein n=1 Tax=Dactylosporangium sp. CA-052675 TaxID=3239927 RepID=UPI003D8DEEA7